MTGMFSIFLAIGAGWFAPPGKAVALAVTLPYVAICAFQSISLALGYGVNPPDTVSDLSYWVVQALILAITLGAADQISRLRSRREPAEVRRGARRAVAVNAGLTVALVGVFYLLRPELDPGSVAHHTGTGGPPWAGLAGIGTSLVVLLALALAPLVGRRLHPARR
jgi:hypothetical protein